MILRSLALKTELGLAATRATIVDRGDYVAITTPDDPGYYFGNLLVLPAPPQVGEVAFWVRRFAAEFPQPEIKHVTLWWDGVSGDAGAEAELAAAGFTLERSAVMTASRVTALPPPLPIVALSPDQVITSVELGWAIADRHDDAYRVFLSRRAHWHARLVERGLAAFYGVYDRGELVASLGLVAMDKVARYQDVATAAAYRKRGLASALLAAAARDVPADRYVILTSVHEAERVYARAGFQHAEHTVSACRRPR
ncbi:MAG: GNAT family N-acetyltransferase [Kofleriaceae bacterium]